MALEHELLFDFVKACDLVLPDFSEENDTYMNAAYTCIIALIQYAFHARSEVEWESTSQSIPTGLLTK